MGGYVSEYRSDAGAVALDEASATAAAKSHVRAADSVSDVAGRVVSSFDPGCVGTRYADVVSTLTSGVDAAGAALREWGASSAAVADAVRASIRATTDVDDSSATAVGDVWR